MDASKWNLIKVRLAHHIEAIFYIHKFIHKKIRSTTALGHTFFLFTYKPHTN